MNAKTRGAILFLRVKMRALPKPSLGSAMCAPDEARGVNHLTASLNPFAPDRDIRMMLAAARPTRRRESHSRLDQSIGIFAPVSRACRSSHRPSTSRLIM